MQATTGPTPKTPLTVVCDAVTAAVIRARESRPGVSMMPTGARWLLAHEVGHVYGLRHVPDAQTDRLMMRTVTAYTNLPPDVVASEAATMRGHALTRPYPASDVR